MRRWRSRPTRMSKALPRKGERGGEPIRPRRQKRKNKKKARRRSEKGNLFLGTAGIFFAYVSYKKEGNTRPLHGRGARGLRSVPLNLIGERGMGTGCPHPQCFTRRPQSIPVPMDCVIHARKIESPPPATCAPTSPITTVIHSFAAVSMNSESYGTP